MNKIFNYIDSIKAEMKHVIWPTKKVTINYTILVLAISIVTAIFLYELDNLFVAILNIFIK